MSKSPRRLAKPIDGEALFRDVTAIEGLTRGWRRVAENGGAAGGDGMTIARFSHNAAERLVELSRSLRDGSYRPGPLRCVDIPKSAGGVRRLTIPPVADRVVQSAVAQTLTPLLDQEFEEGSFGYRPGRGVADAVRRVEDLRRQGYVWAVDADIDDFFDTIPIDALIRRLTRSISESPLIDLIARWLEHAATLGRGIAQGSPLSPLLANLYLDDLDEAIASAGVRIVRYADDFVVLTKDRPAAEAALARIERSLAEHGLRLDRDKTKLKGYDESLKFLGTSFVRGWALRLEEAERGQGEHSFEALLREIARVDEKQALETQGAAEEEAREQRAGLDRGIRLLHVGEPGRRLGLRNFSFAVHEAAERVAPGAESELVAIHPARIDRIEIGPRVTPDLAALRHALAHGIPVAFLDGHGATEGQLAPVIAPRAFRHLAQARHLLDPSLRLALARIIAVGRIANQRSLLRRINHRRGVMGVDEIAVKLGAIIRKAQLAESIDTAMGFEGAATALFWRGWGSLLLNGFSLDARRRRENADPVNIALDVLAGLLARDFSAIVLSVGLHPGFGVLHAVSDARDACVYDLMEEFRAGLIESTVLEL